MVVDEPYVRSRQFMRPANLLLRVALLFLLMAWGGRANAASVQKHYFAHDAVQDQYGVIAPWCKADWIVRLSRARRRRNNQEISLGEPGPGGHGGARVRLQWTMEY